MQVFNNGVRLGASKHDRHTSVYKSDDDELMLNVLRCQLTY